MKEKACSKFAVTAHRFGQATDSEKCRNSVRAFRLVLRPLFCLLQFLSVSFCKILIHESTELGKGLRLSPKGNIIIGAEKIGNACIIHHNVTFGMNLDGKDFAGKPNVADRVWVGPNSIIYGNITIGDGVTILGGTVLTKNVPDRCVVSGNPGRIVKRDFDNTRLLNSSSYDVTAQTLEE